ncbi:MAG: hypothetical protein NZ739_07210 [Verrucomicrobiae bacterium]|nr:hypothetical protein [Verrucomicrobiae bacterium]MCX7723153.1 hypothetical protein [Verrucomicrobiae bacterium]MDW7979859.1 hypothetical protein [Verrucomicrobiales bacterium]
MPIRLNLLAEQQLAEELRRRDPVKRAVLVGLVLVGLMLLWASWLQVAIQRKKRELRGLQYTIKAQTNLYQEVLLKQEKLKDAHARLVALHQLATNRFLWGTVLNALQQTVVDDVQLIEFKGEQTYRYTEATKPSVVSGKTVPGKPATATEQIVLVLRAKDTGPGEGDAMLHYMETLGNFPYFQQLLGKAAKFQLASRESPQEDPETGRPAVRFTLECRLPERTR